MMTRIPLPLPLLPLLLFSPVAGCAQGAGESSAPAALQVAERINAAGMVDDIRTLAADSMEGRQAGTPGGARAREFLVARFREIGLQPFGGDFLQPFPLAGASSPDAHGVNVVGYLRGTEHPDRHMVVTAHYDHLGIRDGQVYNGADDNASGTAALLALAGYFRENPPRHTLVFAATDAEEGSVHGGAGLQGARAFVAEPPVPLEEIVLNLNMDMVSRNERNELYAAGTYHYPGLLPVVERVAEQASVRLLTGHDRPDLPPGDDWTMASDHGAFHAVGIPFVYFGVEDHPDYHQPTDTFDNIDPDFYVRAVETVLDFLLDVDGALGGSRP